MNNCLLLLSHLGANSNLLFGILNDNPLIQGSFSDTIFTSPEDIITLCAGDHKVRNASAIFMEKILFNYNISSKHIYKMCKKVYFVRSAEDSISDIVSNENIHPSAALRYYCYRLRRLAEIAETGEGILVRFEDIEDKKDLSILENYLGLSVKLKARNVSTNKLKGEISKDILEKAQERYEWYLYFLKQRLLSIQ